MLSILFQAAILHHPAQPQEVPPAEAVVDDVLVTASRTAPRFDPFAPFELLCFDGNRLTGAATAPASDDPLWIPLDAQERRRVGVVEDSVQVFRQERADFSLLLKIDERRINGLVQNRCHLTVVGQHDPDDLTDGMRRLFQTAPTWTHVGRVKGYQPMPGWRQLAWTAMPNRDTTRWRGYEARDGSGYVVVSRPFFYRDYAWVIGDLRFSEDRAMPVSELTLTLRYRP